MANQAGIVVFAIAAFIGFKAMDAFKAPKGATPEQAHAHAFKTGFMSTCKISQSAAFCECAVDHVIAHHGSELDKISLSPSDPGTKSILGEAADACR